MVSCSIELQESKYQIPFYVLETYFIIDTCIYVSASGVVFVFIHEIFERMLHHGNLIPLLLTLVFTQLLIVQYVPIIIYGHDIKANAGNPVFIVNKMIRFLFILVSMYVTYTAVAIPVRMSM